MKKSFLKSSFLVACGIVVSCRPADSSDTSGVGVAKKYRFPSSDLTVCWSTFHPSQKEARDAMQANILKNYNKTNIRLTFSKQHCQDLGKNFDIGLFIWDDPDFEKLTELRDQISDAPMVRRGNEGNPRVRFVAKDLRGEVYGVLLNTTAKGRLPEKVEAWGKLEPMGKHNYMLFTSVHEMGHALGLRHEHAHPNSTCEYFDEDLLDDLVITEYDKDSIMNYCVVRNPNGVGYNVAFNKAPLAISPGDIKTINTMYPPSKKK